MRSLRGQVEDQAFQIEDLKRRQRDQYLDLDQRLTERAAGGPSAAGMAAGAQTPAGVGGDVPEVREAVDRPSTVTAVAAPTTESRTAQAAPEMEQEAYDEAFRALKELRYADAAQAFQDFLANYPASEYADNAQYWLGESYYVTRNYEIALEAFEELQRSYPDSTKAGDALLKIGFTHYELKQYDEARAALEQVQERYANSTLARLAESRLRAMRLEGHL
ncbi:MAG: tol-pal system protein YbgF [Gammaproteobacteria bacterium]